MQNLTITLKEETICKLKNLMDEIDFQESLEEDCDNDIVISNAYAIFDILRPILR